MKQFIPYVILLLIVVLLALAPVLWPSLTFFEAVKLSGGL